MIKEGCRMHSKALQIDCGSLVFFGGLGFTICWFNFLLFRLEACGIVELPAHISEANK